MKTIERIKIKIENRKDEKLTFEFKTGGVDWNKESLLEDIDYVEVIIKREKKK